MMASPSELSFDCKPHIFSMLQKSFGDQATEHTQKLEDFLACLEEERLKIDAFKRELPLCMQLLNNGNLSYSPPFFIDEILMLILFIKAAMEASRQQLQSEMASQGARPVLEQFIPLKNTNSCNVEINEGIIAADKANWMTSAQLWNQESEGAKAPQETDIKLALNGKQRMNGGGAFLPFTSKDRGSSPSGEGFPELALASSHKEEMEDKRNSSETKRESSARCGNGSVEKEQTTNASQTHRKARRCWSPDLHRRFVNALHMLGGSQGKFKLLISDFTQDFTF